jgi:class 3 adenylate cyclase
METVCLFADISGFTKVSEGCAKKGVRGNEELAFCINRYMEGMVKHLLKYGGDIIKFVGDAMIVMWPQDKKKPTEAEAKFSVKLAI